MFEYDLRAEPNDDSDEYWHDYAQRAKSAGWQITELSVSPPRWSIFCPKCKNEKTNP